MEKLRTDSDKIPFESPQDSDILSDEVLHHLFEPAPDLSFFDYETSQSNLSMPGEPSPRFETPQVMPSIPRIPSGTPAASSGEVPANHEISERETTTTWSSREGDISANRRTLCRKERLEEERRIDFEIKFSRDSSWLNMLIMDVLQSKRRPDCVLEAIDEFANERKEKVKKEETEKQAGRLKANSLTAQARRRILNLISAKASTERLQSSEYAARQLALILFQKLTDEPASTELSSKRRRADPDESQDSNQSPGMFSPHHSSSGSSKPGNNSSNDFGSGAPSSSGGTNTMCRSWSLSVPSIPAESPCIDQTPSELLTKQSKAEPKELSDDNEQYSNSSGSDSDTEVARNSLGDVEPTPLQQKLTNRKLSKRISDPVLIDSIPLLRLPPAMKRHEYMN